MYLETVAGETLARSVASNTTLVSGERGRHSPDSRHSTWEKEKEEKEEKEEKKEKKEREKEKEKDKEEKEKETLLSSRSVLKFSTQSMSMGPSKTIILWLPGGPAASSRTDLGTSPDNPDSSDSTDSSDSPVLQL